MYSVIKEEQSETIAAEKVRKLIIEEVENVSEEEKRIQVTLKMTLTFKLMLRSRICSRPGCAFS